MNSRPYRGPGARQPWPPLARITASIPVLASTALLAAACSAAPSSAGSGGAAGTGAASTAGAAVRYTNCMRSHGVPSYPDPNGSGDLPKITPGNEAQLGVSESRFSSAQTACQALWPYQGPTQAQQRQELTEGVTFARCMRAHGVPTWPDPTTDSESGRVVFVISGGSGIDLNSAQTLDKARACERGVPAFMLPRSPAGIEVTTSP